MNNFWIVVITVLVALFCTWLAWGLWMYFAPMFNFPKFSFWQFIGFCMLVKFIIWTK